MAALCAVVLILAGCSGITRFNVEQYQSDPDLLEEGLLVTAYYSDGEVDAGVLVAHTPNFLTLVTDAGKEKTVNVSELTFIGIGDAFSLGRTAGLVGTIVGGGMLAVAVVASALLLLLVTLYALFRLG